MEVGLRQTGSPLHRRTPAALSASDPTTPPDAGCWSWLRPQAERLLADDAAASAIGATHAAPESASTISAWVAGPSLEPRSTWCSTSQAAMGPSTGGGTRALLVYHGDTLVKQRQLHGLRGEILVFDYYVELMEREARAEARRRHRRLAV